MMNNIEIYETIKEFSIYTGLINETVKARISKLLPKNSNDPVLYFWFISHYYKPEKDFIDVYIPSKNFGESIIEVEESLMKYIKHFSSIDVKKNNSY